MSVYTLPRPLIDYAPSVRDVMRQARLRQIRSAVIDLLLALAVTAFILGAYRITRAVDEYFITAERNATLAAEVGELRARVAEFDEWDCRRFTRPYAGREHQWCSREVRP